MRTPWMLVTPAPGQRGFSSILLAALFDPAAPTHVWFASDPASFAMRPEDYRRWMESSPAPIRAISAQVKTFPLDCGLALNAAIELLRCEMPGIMQGLATDVCRTSVVQFTRSGPSRRAGRSERTLTRIGDRR